MTEQMMTRVVQLPSRGQITLPTDFRRKLGLSEGDLMRMTLVGEKIEIQPVRTADARLRQYTEAEVQQFLEDDQIDAETAAAVRRLLATDAL
jgi:AbrB family looped-hinge helix DNA binding protein